MNASINIIDISEKLLLAVKMRSDTILLEKQLGVLSLDELQKQISSDAAKKTFWINCYNAYFQLLSKREKLPRSKIFKSKSISIANTKFSLDDIEHGILRRFKWKWSFGYLSNPFTNSIIKQQAVNTLDYRIHFALNCGAKSCPPIAFYNLQKIEMQLDNAMLSFLESETTIDNMRKTITTSRLFHWYRGDFGGNKGIKMILQKTLDLKSFDYKLTFSKYQWETHIENYV